MELNSRREFGQLPSQPIANPRNNPPGFVQLPLPMPQPHQVPMPQKGPQVENAKAISALRSGKILADPHESHNSNRASPSKPQRDDSDSESEEEPMIITKENEKGKKKSS